MVKNKTKCTTKVGTWNVRTLLQAGKLENVIEEMESGNISILGISEIRWKNHGDYENDDGYRLIYSGGEKRGQHGVGIILDREHAKKVVQVKCINEREWRLN